MFEDLGERYCCLEFLKFVVGYVLSNSLSFELPSLFPIPNWVNNWNSP